MPPRDQLASPSPPAIFVDMGTTNTRAWLVHEREVVGRHQVATGARDTARTGSRLAVEESLRVVCRELEQLGQRMNVTPTSVVAAGMIGSAQGIVEVPHVGVPAGLCEIAAGSVRLDLPFVTHLPVVLIPGVRTSAAGMSPIEDADVMRGEETLCLGLLDQARIRAGTCLLNLGSHWKLIGIDDESRIAWSETTLSGELAQAAWRETILASALPEERAVDLDSAWIVRGRTAMRERGVARALFCIRLLAQQGASTPVERLAFLYGVFLESDLSPWLRRHRLSGSVAIVGRESLARSWGEALAGHGVHADIVTPLESESAVIFGLDCLRAAAAVRLGL